MALHRRNDATEKAAPCRNFGDPSPVPNFNGNSLAPTPIEKTTYLEVAYVRKNPDRYGPY